MSAANARFDGSLLAGRYRLGPLLGRGGQGTTYLALDRTTQERVAVKAFDLSRVENWKELELFQRECRVLQDLDHPGIPRYLDQIADEEEGRFYLVMEYVPGRSLRDELRRTGPFDEQDAWQVALQVTDILSHLHVRVPPIVHRDIKPSNLVRRPDGQVVLVDFGGVRDALRPDGGSTVVGTFGYMAPEQLHGQAEPATDMFALGATLLYLLTGTEPERLPRKGLRIRIDEALTDVDGVSADLKGALQRLVEPDPDKRPQSAMAFREELTSGVSPQALADDEADDLPAPAESAQPAIPPDLPFPIAMFVGAVLFFVSIAAKLFLASAEYVFIPLIFAMLLVFTNSDETKRDLKIRERAFKRGVRTARRSVGKAASNSRKQLRDARRWGRSEERRNRRRDPEASERLRALREHERRARQQQRHRHRHHVRRR